MRFIKMHGIGNDYVYVNGFAENIPDPVKTAVAVSHRQFGIGGDGLILVLPPDEASKAQGAHVRMRMFNNDGSESEMCGNGVRCVCKLTHDHGISSANPMKVQTGRGVLTLAYTLDAQGKVAQITVDMGEPILEAAKIPTKIPGIADNAKVVDASMESLLKDHPELNGPWVAACGADLRMTCVSMGNPHVTIYVKDVAKVPLETIGPIIERDIRFPRKINVHFVEVHSPTEVTMRTWERGSGITLACGTGASAVAVSGVLTGRGSRKILAHLPGGDLTLEWKETDNHLYMTGPATEVFTGEWNG